MRAKRTWSMENRSVRDVSSNPRFILSKMKRGQQSFILLMRNHGPTFIFSSIHKTFYFFLYHFLLIWNEIFEVANQLYLNKNCSIYIPPPVCMVEGRIWQPEEKEIFLLTKWKLASLVVQTVKNLSAIWKTWFRSLGWEDPLEEGMVINSSILAWRIPIRQRSLVGYSPWGHKESDMTEWLTLSLACGKILGSW